MLAEFNVVTIASIEIRDKDLEKSIIIWSLQMTIVTIASIAS